jgi:hypothetical protein
MFLVTALMTVLTSAASSGYRCKYCAPFCTFVTRFHLCFLASAERRNHLESVPRAYNLKGLRGTAASFPGSCRSNPSRFGASRDRIHRRKRGRGRPSASKAAASKAKIAPPYFFINIRSKARLVPSKPPASSINRVKGAYGCLASQLPYNPLAIHEQAAIFLDGQLGT